MISRMHRMIKLGLSIDEEEPMPVEMEDLPPLEEVTAESKLEEVD